MGSLLIVQRSVEVLIYFLTECGCHARLAKLNCSQRIRKVVGAVGVQALTPTQQLHLALVGQFTVAAGWHELRGFRKVVLHFDLEVAALGGVSRLIQQLSEAE